MNNWNKKDVSRETVKELHDTYGVDALTASILARRGITKARDIVYYLETDLRYLHNPFLFSDMEDAVDRINNAREEGEKVLVFGDDDVDGVSSTAILYQYLKKQGFDVRWRLPTCEEGYGLSMQAVDDFAKDYGSLIITVDCGISNNAEIAHAAELGLDVIITDHHNPPETLPSPAIIIDPKIEGCGYPFSDISGAAVAFKLVSALRFSKSDLYKQEICLLDSEETENSYRIDCRKIRNLVQRDSFTFTGEQGGGSVMDTDLPSFLSGQQIFVWDGQKIQKQLADMFGTGIVFNMMDLRPAVSQFIPQLADKDLTEAKQISRVMKYIGRPASEMDAFHSLFITFVRQKIHESFPSDSTDRDSDLQLVMLAALADIMPMKNENRILVRAGLSLINAGKIRPGLSDLFARLSISGRQICSSDLSWSVIPALNAAGRVGQPGTSLKLLLSDDPAERSTLAQQIIDMNEKRKELVSYAVGCIGPQAEESVRQYEGKLCVVIDERINKGITGILASRLVNQYNVPAIAVTFDKETATGSMRCCRGFNATDFLNKFGDFFINHGGHDYAAGFSFARSRMVEFSTLLKSHVQDIKLAEQHTDIDIDAELPQEYLTPQLLQIVDKFEPFGDENPEIVFFSHSLQVCDATTVGKTEPRHLKITLDCGKYKYPAIFWREAERLNRDFKTGDKLDLLYSVGRNTFNGMVTPQLIITDLKRSESKS